MTMQFNHSPSRHAKSSAADRRMCRRLVTLTLPAFLVATAVRRMIRPAPAGRRLSLYAEARASAYATIPFMFMG
jgi:hypothetical protein